MRRYETIVIAHPSLSQEDRQPFFDKLTNIISESQGLLVKVEEWGQKRLAYEIKKQTRGYYALLDYCGDGGLVREVERNIRLDDRGLKYMTVCVAQVADLEEVKAEIAAAQQQKTAASESTPNETPEEQTAAEQPAETETTSGPAGETPEPDKNEEATNGTDI